MKLSIIIPAFNREQELAETIRSLLCQSVAADEIIVVDDGSTDRTVTVAKSFGPLVRVIRQDQRGPGAARNAGLAVAQGEFIHFFDSDDLASDNKHAVQLAALESSGADIAYGPWVKGKFAADTFTPDDLFLQQHSLPAPACLIGALLNEWSVIPHAALFRRQIIEAAGGFSEDLRIGEDQMMFLRCLLKGAKLVHTPDTAVFYRTGNPKLTSAPQWADHRVVDWARFLLAASEACHAEGIQTDRWSGYRLRIWQALGDLAAVPDVPPELPRALRALLGKRTPEWSYGVMRQIRRYRAGLQSRLGRGRYPACFHSGQASLAQIAALRRLGYSLGS